MDVITILDIIASYIEDNDIDLFKLGFVGNGEPMLDYEKFKQYIAHIGDYLKSGRISKNSFVGVNQSKQTGKTGPDTADRLFNLIKKRY